MRSRARSTREGRRKFLLEMATGTGKTLLCAALIRRFLPPATPSGCCSSSTASSWRSRRWRTSLSSCRSSSQSSSRPPAEPGELLGSSVVVATIQSLMVDRRYREEFTPFYFDLVINDEAHRSIYGDAREVVQFFQATRIGLTATPKAYLKNINIEQLEAENPKALEARQLRDTYHYFGCEPGFPTYPLRHHRRRQRPGRPFLCLPKIFDLRSDITTQALAESGWAVVINEQEENFKIQDLERKIFTPARNRLMCEAFLKEAQRDPTGAARQVHRLRGQPDPRDQPHQDLQRASAGIAVTITSRIPDASSIAKEFRDGKRTERIAVSVDMLSTGYNCRDLLNIGLMRPIFSPTEYIQIKGRGTRRYTFKIGNTEYEKKNFFLLDFCAVAEYFEEKYDYSVPLKAPAREGRKRRAKGATGGSEKPACNERRNWRNASADEPQRHVRFPVWEGTDILVSREVDRGRPEWREGGRDDLPRLLRARHQEFVEADADMKAAVDD